MVKKVENGCIYGYNNNEKLLKADGWLKYEGTAPLSHLKLVNGEIVELIIPIPEPTPMPKTYTKLQIRRALRQAGKEQILDDFLANNEIAGKDWQDAQEIALDDEVLIGTLPASLKQELISVMEGQKNDSI